MVWANEEAAVQAKVDGIVEKEQSSAAEVAELINTDPNQVWPISQAERDSASEAVVWFSLGKGGEGGGKKIGERIIQNTGPWYAYAHFHLYSQGRNVIMDK